MASLNVASFGFLIGAMGHWAFYGRLLPRLQPWALMTVLLIPWFMVFVITFCNRPPFGPRTFRRSLLLAMSLYVLVTLIAETLHLFLQPAPRGHFSLTAARIVIYCFGAITIAIFLRACKALHRLETTAPAKHPK
jgi:hypothetical protein